MTSLKAATSFTNFARGQIDHDMDGRFDLPIYQTGARTFKNWISNFKGNAIFRAGFENLISFQDCGLLEFRFSQNQNYILTLYNNTMKFLSYDVSDVFGIVQNGGGDLSVTTPYSLAESKEIAFRKAYTQNFDSVIVTHKDHEPRELKRLAANDFRFTTYSRKDDPFPLTWDSTKNITAVTKAEEATITITGHGYSVNDRFKIESVAGMTELNDWTAAVIEVVDANNVKVDIDTTDFTTYTSGGTAAKVLTGDYPDTCLYYKGRLYYGGTAAKITTVYASESGQYKIHTIPTTVVAESALEFTIAELDSRIEWMFRGQNSLIVGTVNDIVAVHGGSVGEAITAETIDTTDTDADGGSNVEPLAKDGFIFYVSNDKRRLHYFSYDILSETFGAEDANVLSHDITFGGITKIRYAKSREDLIFGLRSDGKLLSCNFNKKENIIGWHLHDSEGTFKDIASISDNNGVQQIFTLVTYGGSYYIERQAAYKEFSKRSTFFSGVDSRGSTTNRKADDEAHYRKLAEELKDCIYLDNAEVVQNLRSETITYDSGAGTITASGSVFSSGDVGKHIAYRTSTGYEAGRFEITAYNSATSVDVEVLVTPTTNSYADWYLSFSTVSGLARFNGETVSVVADGGYLADFTVSGGSIDLDTQATHVVIGYDYRGTIEAFSLGFQVQAENTQVTMKAVSEITLRCHNTAGGKVGTSAYRLEEVQDLTQEDLNYLPPVPVNGTKSVPTSDDHDIDKGVVIVQDVPLPMTVTAVVVDGSYAITT